MKMYRLEYARPRQSYSDKSIVIWERKTHMIEADDDEWAKIRADIFIAWQGAVNKVAEASIYKLYEVIAGLPQPCTPSASVPA